MSLLLHLLAFLPLINGFPYGIIRNKSINATSGSIRSPVAELNVSNPEECLCHAFAHATLPLFTFHRSQSSKFFCQFYSAFPYGDEVFSNNDTDIYLLKNGTFKDRYDCCNTEELVQKLGNTNLEKLYTAYKLRFLVRGNSDLLAATTSISNNASLNYVLRFSRPYPTQLGSGTTSNTTSVGYCQSNFYLGTLSHQIEIYSRNLYRQPTPALSIGYPITSIRFLADQQMLVATNASKIFVYSKDSNGTFTVPSTVVDVPGPNQLHGIAVVNSTAFYTGANAESNSLRLFIKNGINWTESVPDRIDIAEPITDLVIDNCQRLWAVGSRSKALFIYEKDNKIPFQVPLNVSAFNLVILDLNTFMTSHDVDNYGLSRIQVTVNCTNPSLPVDPCLL